MSRDWHEQKDRPRIGVSLVDPDKDPMLPVEQRVNREKTAELHQRIREKGSRLMASLQAATGVALPTKEEVQAISAARAQGWAVCSGCVHFDYAAGQQGLLKAGGVEYLLTECGPTAVEQLGDWRKFGHCGALEGIRDALWPAWSCPHFERVSPSKFGRLVGSVWRRFRDI
jgi:hypothetical protein